MQISKGGSSRLQRQVEMKELLSPVPIPESQGHLVTNKLSLPLSPDLQRARLSPAPSPGSQRHLMKDWLSPVPSPGSQRRPIKDSLSPLPSPGSQGQLTHQRVRNWIESSEAVIPTIVVEDVSSERGGDYVQKNRTPCRSPETVVSVDVDEIPLDNTNYSCSITNEDEVTTLLADGTKSADVLDQNVWDQFQMVPRDTTDNMPNFKFLLQGMKVTCYIVLFVLVLSCAVINKLSLLTLTSGLVKNTTPTAPSPTNAMLLMCMCIPYVCCFFAYTARSVFGNSGWPTLKMVFSVLILESMHSTGLCLLVFNILPRVDMIRAHLLMTSILVIPAMCKAICSTVEQTTSKLKRFFDTVASLLAFTIQLGGVVLCTVAGLQYSKDEEQRLQSEVMHTDTVQRGSTSFWEDLSWEIPVSLTLISVMTWENFINHDLCIGKLKLPFTVWKKNLHLLRQRLYVFVSVWKIAITILLAILFCDDFQFTFQFSEGETETTNSTTSSVLHFQQYGPLYAHLFSSILCSYFGSLACKMCMQRFSFSLPLTFVIPVCVTIVMLKCHFDFPAFVGDTFVWVCPKDDDPWLTYHLGVLGMVWLAQVIITLHIWFPDSSRMAKIEKLFVTPIRCSILTDQFLMLRRRRDDHYRLLLSYWDVDSLLDDDLFKPDAAVPLIYACATMWHETVEEMTLLLKSLFRIDIDHSARYLAQKYYGIKDPDYYEFEAHIFFDDAMELTADDKMVPNNFVVDLISCVDEALSSVHERQMSLGPPSRTPTPYGGRLTWNLPGGTQLNVHLKDKVKIRHKKRWSQVMYMYYLLGYRILAISDESTPEDILLEKKPASTPDKVRLTPSQLRRRRRCAHYTRSVIFNSVSEEVQTRAENTFILALDGDVDFRPDAVTLLVDRMKKNKKVGAACGRIHPTGSGPMIWYQMFEYAIGHWLQKSTEHVFGCVLCAPGCFTLFRGSALMDDNMTRTYAKRSTQAGHYVQYDQGEDRWLSTLLLQQGYRIDYCAAADAFTHAPETFSEFFNQRRRWGPSTLANIIDLLSTWKSAVRINDNLSSPYIFYQVALLVSTILGPATVLLMMAGAYSVVFKTSVFSSHMISVFPAVGYIIVCLYTKPQTQLMVGAFLSAIYAIMMTIVLVGTVRTCIDGTITSPNVVFIIMLAFIFVSSGVLHPAEFGCVVPGLLYFISIPASYLVLNIYFLCNLNVVSWGTREAPKKKTKEHLEREKLEEEERKTKRQQKKGILSWFGFEYVILELGEFFKQLRSAVTESFTVKNESKKKSTDQLLEELILEIRKDRVSEQNLNVSSEKPESLTEVIEKSREAQTHETRTQSHPVPEFAAEVPDSVPKWLRNEDPRKPGWLTSPDVGRGPVVQLADQEDVFWRQLIQKYLQPLSDDKEHKDKMSAELKTLRNNVVFGFFMVTALWVAFFLQLEILQDELEDYLYIKIPRLDSSKDPLTFQPFGLVFFVFFAFIIIFQFVGMLVHRWGTILHMLSITDISVGQNFTEEDKIKDIIQKVAELQRMRNIELEPEPDYDEPLPDYDVDKDENKSSFSETSVLDNPPPSYHSQEVKKRTEGQRREIFNRLGQPTPKALQCVFEKRYRNERVRYRAMGEEYDGAFRRGSLHPYPEPDYANY